MNRQGAQQHDDLEQAAQRMRSVVDHVLDGIITINEQGTVITFNPAAERIFAYRAVEVIGRNVKLLMPEPFHSEHDSYLQSYLQTGKAKIIGIGREVVGRRQDGSTFPMDLAVSQFSMGSERFFTGIVRDVSERKQAESSQKLLSSIIKSSDDGILAVTRQGTILAMNPGAERLYAYTSKELVGQSIAVLAPEHRRDEPEQWLDSILAGQHLSHIETEQIRRDGRFVTVSLTLSAIEDAEGGVAGMSCIAHDITERKQAEEELRDAEARIRAVVDHVVDGIITIDETGLVTAFNLAAETLFGHQAADVIGRNVKLLMPEPFSAEHDGYISSYLRTGQAKIIGIGREVVGRRRNGSTFPMDLAVSEFYLGKRRFFTGIVRDISERKRAQKQLQEAMDDLARSNVDLQHFAYAASHDLQEPLRAVGGCVQVLQRRYQGQLDARADELIKHVVDGVSRMQTLINDLLKYSRVGTRGRAFGDTDCNVALRQALANLEMALKETGTQVTKDDLPVISADQTQLTQLLQNLIGNAVKFRNPAVTPKVHVGVKRRSGDWLFSISDNGIGIDPQYFERIFVIFQRLHTRHEFQGTGIGLAICKKIVERHQGQIWVESSVGGGSKFYFTLPGESPP